MSGIIAKPAEVSVAAGVVLLDASPVIVPVLVVAVDVPAVAVVVVEVVAEVVSAVEPLIEVAVSVSNPGPPSPQPRIAASRAGAAPNRNVRISPMHRAGIGRRKSLGPLPTSSRRP
jgi:hypothetical protein